MRHYLCISATLLAGRYHGREWPPAPARLLKALVSGAMTGSYRRHWPRVEAALRWLERQPSPGIVAAVAQQTSGYRLAVPNNDLDVAAKEWSKGRSYDAARLKTMKSVSPRKLPDGPHVHYLWPVDADVPEDGVRTLARCLHTLGWGVDMAYADARVVDEDTVRQLPGVRYLPSDEGNPLETPVEGFLDDVLQTYHRFCSRQDGKSVNPDTRTSVYGLQPYRREGDASRPWAAFSLRTPDGAAAFSVDCRRSMIVAAWLRHASSEAFRQEGTPQTWIDGCVLGHRENCERNGPRLSFLPLPSIGHAHSDGRVRRVAVVGPIGEPDAPLRLLDLKLRSSLVTDEEGRTACRLGRIENENVVLPFYRRRARRWLSVTPVILHGFNSQRGRLSLAKTERLLMQAFDEAGFPSRGIESLSFQPAPYWAGTEAALQIRVPAHLAQWPRCHVAVEFREDVDGPVLAGIGRHYGLGLFAAEG